MNLSKLKIIVFGGTGLVGSGLVKKLKLSNYFLLRQKEMKLIYLSMVRYANLSKILNQI